MAATAFSVLLWAMVLANARDHGQWGNQDPATRKWFNSLMLPGDPATSCCGKSDAYWADNFDSKDGQYVAIITDPRPDGPLGRAHIEPGTRIRIPNGSIIWGQGKSDRPWVGIYTRQYRLLLSAARGHLRTPSLAARFLGPRVRFGSKADICIAKRDAPKSGHSG